MTAFEPSSRRLASPSPGDLGATGPIHPAGARAASITIEDVSKSYGSVAALRNVSLGVPSGSLLALLGPSGSGKTTLLMSIAGFEQPDRGRILLDGVDLTRLPPHRRNIGMVFQRYALFPHLSVGENVAYPLRRRGVGRARRDEMVRASLDMVELAHCEDRLPSQLSGGQQQRVALARALVYGPPLLLMDEPLGALDRKLREGLQVEIKQLQRRLGTTIVFVTHDQQEALSMADRVAVLRHGRIVQTASPRELYESPVNSFVADFLGEANLFAGTAESRDGQASLRAASGESLPGTVVGALAPGAMAELAVRPSEVVLSGAEPRPGWGIAGRVVETIFAGETTAVLIELGGGTRLTARVPAAAAVWSVGDLVTASWRAERAWLFPSDPKRS